MSVIPVFRDLQNQLIGLRSPSQNESGPFAARTRAQHLYNRLVQSTRRLRPGTPCILKLAWLAIVVEDGANCGGAAATIDAIVREDLAPWVRLDPNDHRSRL